MPDMIRTVMVEQKMMYEEQIAQLRAERDKARILVCRLEAEARGRDARAAGMSSWFHSPEQIAEENGWDCFSDKAEADANNTLFRTTDGE